MSRYRTRSWRAFEPPPGLRTAGTTQVRILGLDPGSRRTGFGLIESGAQLRVIAHGCLDVAHAAPAQRLRLIFEGLQRLLQEHGPAEVAIERVFVSRNVDSALKLGQARGAALCAIPAGVPVFEYAPRAIKLALVGSGAAEKLQVAHMVTALLALRERPGADAADALAAAICHAHTRGRHLLAAAGVLGRAQGLG
ncbi:MAG: crossover junction endodeoxyribonuclease RuvC [Gammaproteobacteria bacterium]|nr:crossover junction endodeoxyribonuclease RuvC [Gammaproteobacteria bacterium]MBV9695947.1 crossover junction endodeoxyribonuclease RuvC [Gammaproteobacteria bacterium]